MWILIFIFLRLSFIKANVEEENDDNRTKKAFSLFSVVQFDNNECTTPTNDYGTCLTSTECDDRGGSTQGNCASGFGVCCFFKVDQTDCGGTISNNGTYIQNTGYPSSISTGGIDCTYTFMSTTNVCQIRLDFDSATLADPSTTSGSIGKCSTDSLTVTSPSSYYITPLCGAIAGTHMYVETARATSAGTIKISTSSSDTTTSRSWKIRTMFLECETNWKAPTDCLQYMTGISNSFKSFNFGNLMIRNLQYDVCIRPEAGYCRFQLMESSSSTDSFKIDPASTTTTSKVGVTNCDTQFIVVDSYHELSTTMTTRFCGEYLNIIDADTKSSIIIGDGPRMKVGIFSADGDGDTGTQGFDLTYAQIPCGT